MRFWFFRIDDYDVRLVSRVSIDFADKGAGAGQYLFDDLQTMISEGSRSGAALPTLCGFVALWSVSDQMGLGTERPRPAGLIRVLDDDG
jgi:hypothetical protein